METSSLGSALMSIATFGFPALVLLAWLYFRHKTRLTQLEVIGKIIERGDELDPEMEKILKDGYSRSHKLDYRSAVLWIAVGISFFMVLILTTPDQASVALILVAVGIARLIAGFYRWREAE